MFAIGDDEAYDQVLGGHLVAFTNKYREEIDKLADYRDGQRGGSADTIVVPVLDLPLYSEVHFSCFFFFFFLKKKTSFSRFFLERKPFC